MAQRWFVARGEHVYGPWSTDDVRAHRRDGNIFDGDAIWGIGESIWVSLAIWDPARKAAPKPVEKTKLAAVAPVNAQPAPVKTAAVKSAPKLDVAAASEDVTAVGFAISEEVTVVSRPKEAWHFATDGQSHGPYERATLLVELRRLPSVADVSLWTNGMKEWASIFEFHDVTKELGANQRQHARAAIGGKVTMKYDGLSHSVPLTSIGEGGVSVALDSGLFAGQALWLEIESDAFDKPIVVAADVRYCVNGSCGLRFADLNSSARASIARCVKQHATRDAKAA